MKDLPSEINDSPNAGLFERLRMSQILLHIGTPKTGTTSLQHLLASAGPMLKEHGVAYPCAGRGGDAGPAHHKLSWCLTGKHGFTDESCWSELRDELAAAPARLAVVSTEGFEALTAEEIHRVARYLTGENVRVLVYLRNQHDFMLSYFKQFVKSDRRKYRHNLSRFLSENVHRCDYAALIDRWSEVFGSNSVEFRLFDKVRQGIGLERDFLMQIGVQDIDPATIPVRPSVANISPSDDGTRLLRLLNTVESKLPRATIVTKLCHRARRRLMRRDPRTERMSSIMAPLVTPRWSTPADIDFLRNCVTEFNQRFFPRLSDAADQRLFDF